MQHAINLLKQITISAQVFDTHTCVFDMSLCVCSDCGSI